jgi:hypothetical protein
MLLYDDFNYAAGRLIGTVVLYKKRPVLINDMAGNNVHFQDILTGKTNIVHWSNDFDLTPVPLGHTNFNGHAYYVARIPMRKDWKQGLRTGNMRGIAVGTDVGVDPGMVGIPYSEIGRTIIGDFPPIKNVITNMQSPGVKSQAFSRAFALDKALNIWHKGCRNIGKIIDGNKIKYELKDEFFWARETLEEAL